jgi:hypothetical protein
MIPVWFFLPIVVQEHSRMDREGYPIHDLDRDQELG